MSGFQYREIVVDSVNDMLQVRRMSRVILNPVNCCELQYQLRMVLCRSIVVFFAATFEGFLRLITCSKT